MVQEEGIPVSETILPGQPLPLTQTSHGEGVTYKDIAESLLMQGEGLDVPQDRQTQGYLLLTEIVNQTQRGRE